MTTPDLTNATSSTAAPMVSVATIALPLQGVDARQDNKEKWKLLIGAAKLRWSKLTVVELQKTEGIEHQLAVLVQGRYDIPRGDAYRQVKSFHEAQKA
jgi:uncharacterized protein YjbJ (UPF0337 family)